MGTPILILGQSGTGKTSSIRNVNPAETLLIQAVRKPLPFRAPGWDRYDHQSKTGTVAVSDNWGHIIQMLTLAENLGREIVIIDDFQAVLAGEFMRRCNEPGYQKFTEIARHTWEILGAAQRINPTARIYFLSHTDIDDGGNTRCKTLGKMIDEKFSMEGHFTIVLKTVVSNGEYFFATRNSGSDTVKSPIGLFEAPYIENDLAFVDGEIATYYGIGMQPTPPATQPQKPAATKELKVSATTRKPRKGK